MNILRLGRGPRISQAVIYNGVVYVAGQVAGDKSQDIQNQTRQVLSAIDTVLKQAGTNKSRLLSAQVFLAHIDDLKGLNEAWEAWIDPANPPARTTVEARLADPMLKVEICVTAAVGEGLQYVNSDTSF